jgi:hypothetical protein
VIVMNIYDLCVAWNWIYDADFINLLNLSCQSHGLSLLQIKPENLPQTLNLLVGGELGCRVFFDRASDEDPDFMPLVQWVNEGDIRVINPYEQSSHTWNKAEMHSRLVKNDINVPLTFVLPAYLEQPDISPIDLNQLGDQFTIKPAHGSGGVGVMVNATSWDQVLTVRKEHAADQYLLQAHVSPTQLNNRPAWFRVIYCADQSFPSWWDPATHIYTPVSDAEIVCLNLDPLNQITAEIADMCGLNLFSTEIALTTDNQFMVVDYVNDQLDLRLQSTVQEGVPDAIVKNVTEQLARHVEHHCRPNLLS